MSGSRCRSVPPAVALAVALLASAVPSATRAARAAAPSAKGDAGAVNVDYDLVYVRAPRGVKDLHWANTEPPDRNPPGAELVLLRPDGTERVLVPVEAGESIADPYVSFDAQWVYYAKYHAATRERRAGGSEDRKSTRLNSSHG